MTSLLLLKSMLFANALQKTKKKKKKNKIKKTHKVQNISLNMCRICNNGKGDIPIFNNFVQPNIPEEIQNFSGITLNKSDNLSKHMCQSCLDLLNGCIMFREMCQRSNRLLNDVGVNIKKENNQDCQNDEVNIDAKADSEDSYNIPSPSFSDDNEMLSIWGCSTCGEEFHAVTSYTRHIAKCNTQSTEVPKPPEEITKRKFLCDICGKTAFSNASLLVHIHKVQNISLNMCRICNNGKGDIPIFNNFVQPNIPEEIQNFSGITLNKSDNLSKHMCQSCLDLLNGCIMFREMCQRSNRLLNDVGVNIKKENNQDCQNDEVNIDAKADSEDSYNIPSPSFSDDNEMLSIWGCSTCGEEFHAVTSYTRHIAKCNTQSTEVPKPPEEITKRKFLCDICGKTAFSNASLLVHMAIHENVFPFKCDVCPYQGRTMDLLKVHKRSHLVDKPFKCTQCPKATTTSSNLAKHMRHVHSTTRPYKCTYCDKAFSYQHDMKRHVKDIHLRQGTVECDICYKKFNTRKILQGHRWKIHKIKGERQGRLPSYLQCQMEEPNNENNVNENMNNCVPNY